MIRILDAGIVPEEEIFARNLPMADVSDAVSEILDHVRKGGDQALLEYTERFDHVRPERLEVTEEEINEAWEAVGENFIGVLQRAAANIRQFHEKQVRNSFLLNKSPGIIMGQKILPLERVGLYVPGGTAAYPSTVLMNATPAVIAGCREVVITTPPGKDGKVPAEILAAARVAGVHRIFKAGGAQAVAALAYGTETIPKVDKIVGPGNAFVAEAKKQVFGQVSIDMIAGPSEILVISDAGTNPAHLAADLLSQAEHDKNASAVLVTDSMELAEAVAEQIEEQLKTLERQEIARTSIENNGKIIIAKDIPEAIGISNRIAPEHLELCVDDPFRYLDSVVNAGSIFLGRNCPEALGDYLAGPNHTLPTSGTARFFSPLSVDDFVKKSQYTYFTDEAFALVADDISRFARREGLTGHARSAEIRKEGRLN